MLFQTKERAPEKFDRWTFWWISPETDWDADFDYVVLDPKGNEHFTYDLRSSQPGRLIRSDFRTETSDGPYVFFGQHIRFKFRVTQGSIRFQEPQKCYFAFYNEYEDGSMSTRDPFTTLETEIVR